MIYTTDFPTAYMRLRTLIDALEVNTLRYCLDGPTRADCVSRMEGVEQDLLDLIGRVGGGAPCDAGYYNCGGVCLPYTCFEGIAESAESAE